MALFRRKSAPGGTASAARAVSEPVAYEQDWMARNGLLTTSSAAQKKFIEESALWERVRSRLGDEKRWATSAVTMAYPDDPSSRPVHGFGFLTDQQLIFDVSERPDRWEPEHWMTITVPFSKVLAFGSSPVYGPEYLALQVLMPDRPGEEIGSVFLRNSGDPEFRAFVLTAMKLIRQDGGAHVRPEYTALLDRLHRDQNR